jgi:hypothetical protein
MACKQELLKLPYLILLDRTEVSNRSYLAAEVILVHNVNICECMNEQIDRHTNREEQSRE